MARLHRPVMVQEVIELLDAAQGGFFVDATFGGGGHTRAILGAHRDNRVLALDRDPEALAAGRRADDLAGRVEWLHSDYRRLPAELARRPEPAPRGVLVDMGLSTLQLLDPRRGFAFSQDGPLDMRLDRTSGPTAADIVNTAPAPELRRILARLGEERFAGRISAALCRRRQQRPFTRTVELAEAVRDAVPAAVRRQRVDAATRTFQALRIAVNDELSGLEEFVTELATALPPGARLVIIAFHSLEDRPVKLALRRLAEPCVCPPDLPLCACGRTPVVRLLTRRAGRPSSREIAENPASRSARLRAAERLAA